MSFQIKYVYDLVDKISPQLKTIQSNLQTAASSVSASAATMARSFDKVGQSLKNTGQSFKNAGSTLAPASIAMGAIGIKALSSSANLEALGIQLEILTGSAEKGKKLFSELTQYSAETPFQLPEVVKATRTLLGANIPLKDAVSTIKMLGDVSAGSGGDLWALSNVFGQVSGMTKLQGQDAMQFISNGIPIWALLEKSTGKTVTTLRKMATDGQVSFKMVEEALKKATLQGGMYYQATDKLSKSLSGLYSTLKDNVNLAFADLGNEMVKAADIKQLTKDLGEFAGKVTTAFKSLSPEMKKFITYAIIVGTALAPVLLALGSLIAVVAVSTIGITGLAATFSGLATFLALSPFGLWITGLGLLSAAAYLCRDSLVVIYDFLKDQFLAVFDAIIAKIDQAVAAFNKFRTDASSVLSFVGLDSLANSVAPNSAINQAAPINTPQQSFAAGGQLDINLRGLPKGSNTNFTPAPKNFMNVGVNSVYAGAY